MIRDTPGFEPGGSTYPHGVRLSGLAVRAMAGYVVLFPANFKVFAGDPTWTNPSYMAGDLESQRTASMVETSEA